MNDNNKMDRGKEHAGPKKMTPRQKQKRNRKATLAAVLCFVAAIAIVGTYTMRDYKTVKKEGELAKAQLEEQKKALEEASQEASGNAQKDSASESGTDGAGTGGKPKRVALVQEQQGLQAKMLQQPETQMDPEIMATRTATVRLTEVSRRQGQRAVHLPQTLQATAR